MNIVPLHPALVHVPLGVAVVAPFLAIALALAVWRTWLPARAFGLLAGLQALALVAGVAAFQAGEQEEERVEKRVSEQLLEDHEESAERFLWSLGIALFCSAGIVLLRDRRFVRWATVASVAATVGAAGLGIAAGKSGGAVAYGGGLAAVASPATSGHDERQHD